MTDQVAWTTRQLRGKKKTPLFKLLNVSKVPNGAATGGEDGRVIGRICAMIAHYQCDQFPLLVIKCGNPYGNICSRMTLRAHVSIL